MKNILPVALLFVAISSCLEQGQKKNRFEKKGNVVVPLTVADIEPSLREADSLQIIYYDDPDGDSLRYTRFFKYVATSDTAQIGELLRQYDQPIMQRAGPRKCRSEGKLFLTKGEQVLKTVYFSTRGDTCSYFYFIKNGNFFYFPLTTTAEKILQANKKGAYKP